MATIKELFESQANHGITMPELRLFKLSYELMQPMNVVRKLYATYGDNYVYSPHICMPNCERTRKNIAAHAKRCAVVDEHGEVHAIDRKGRTVPERETREDRELWKFIADYERAKERNAMFEDAKGFPCKKRTKSWIPMSMRKPAKHYREEDKYTRDVNNSHKPVLTFSV